MEKIAILYNPSSNRGKSAKKIKKLREFLNNNSVPYSLIVSESLDDFKKKALNLSDDYNYLGIAGGDSSYSIAIDHIIKNQKEKRVPTFVFFPTGSSNDITREFNIYQIEDSIKAIKTGNKKKIDLGIVKTDKGEEFFFLGQVNIGLGAEVNEEVSRLLKTRFPIKNQSVLGFISILKTYKNKKIPLNLEITNNEIKIKGDYLIALFSNIKYWATGRILFPDAFPDDGNLHAITIAPISFSRLLKLDRKVKSGKHLSSEEINITKGKSFKVQSKNPFKVQIDGEILRANDKKTLFNSIEIMIREKRISVLVNT